MKLTAEHFGKKMRLSKSKYGVFYTLVDEDIYQKIKNRNVYLNSYAKNRFYALIGLHGIRISLHRFIMNPPSASVFVDHINGDGLDNRRCNLRFVTPKQNIWNSRGQIKSTSKYKGVSWKRDHKSWVAGIKINGKSVHLGYFASEEDAAKAYNKKSKKIYGEFARLNPA